MKSKNVKVIDEHNIDRDANVMFALELEGSEYVVYWISRDEESNNVFVSKVLKNIDGTYNMLNIDDEDKKKEVAEIVKVLISNSVSDQNDKLVGTNVNLSNGKVAKIVSVSFNKEQHINVAKTYITTVKKEVTKVAENYYDVVVDEVKVAEVLPAAAPVVETPVSVVPPVVETPVMPELDAAVVATPVAPAVEAVAVPQPTPVVVEPITVAQPTVVPQPVVVEQVIAPVATPVVETPVVTVEEPAVVPTPVASAVEAAPVTPTPVVVPHEVAPVPPVVETPVAPVVEATPVVEPANQPLVFNAAKETNLNAALGEVASSTAIPVENITPVREFGVETPAVSQPVAQPAVAPMVQPEVASDPKTLTKKAGFANGKFFMVVAVAFFLASCIFLGYEVYNYFQLVK